MDTEEALFQAQLYAYASPKIYKQWVDFDIHTRKLEVQLIKAKAQSGPSASIRDFPELVSATTEWRRAREELINLIRAELGIRRRRLWRASDEFRLPDWPAEN